MIEAPSILGININKLECKLYYLKVFVLIELEY